MKLDERAMANVEVALDDVFREHPHGGDHGRRKHVARKLMQSARKGITTLGRLTSIAKSALQEITARKGERGRVSGCRDRTGALDEFASKFRALAKLQKSEPKNLTIP